MPELAPCPYCGNEHAKPFESVITECTYIICGNMDCRARGPAGAFPLHAAELWNRRAEKASDHA